MLWSDSEKFRNLSYLERPRSAFQCLDEFHRNTPFLANEGTGTPITSKTRPGCLQCLILPRLWLIAHKYIWVFFHPSGFRRPASVSTRPCQGTNFPVKAVAIHSGLKKPRQLSPPFRRIAFRFGSCVCLKEPTFI